MRIKKWYLYAADLNPRFGTEPGKLRPVVVIQTDLLNSAEHPSTLICPTTTHITPLTKWLRVHLRKGEGGLKEASDILVDQIRAIDNKRFRKELGRLSENQALRLSECIQAILDF